MIPVLLVVPGLVPLLLGMGVEVRWWGCALVVLVVVLMGLSLARCHTVLSAEGIECRQLGRPWLPGRVSFAWRDIAVVGVRRFGFATNPVLRLNDGSVVIVRVPSGAKSLVAGNPRFAEELALMQRYHLDAIGMLPAHAVLPDGYGRASRRRRGFVMAVCAVLIVVDFVAVGVGFAKMVDDGPPPPAACSLVPVDLVRRVVPKAAGGTAQSPTTCRWGSGGLARVEGDSPQVELILTVQAVGSRYARESLKDDRARDSGEHVVRDVPGVRGHLYTQIQSGRSLVTVRAGVTTFTFRLELADRGTGASGVEGRAGEVARSVAAKLGGVS